MTLSALWTNKIYKTGDTSRTGTTLSDDPDLVITLTASKKYRVRFMVLCWANATADFQFDFKAGGITHGVVHAYGNLTCAAPGSSGPVISHMSWPEANIISGTNNIVMNGNNTTTTRGVICGTAVFATASSSPGTFAFRWAQGTNNVTAAKVYTGSHFLWEEF